MTLALEMEGLRGAAGLQRRDHVKLLLVRGPDAFAVLDHASTAALFVREGQMWHTLFLRDDASIFADVYICGSVEGYFVFAEGPTEDDLVKYLEMVRDTYVSGAAMTIERLSSTHELWGVDGPYAWEVVATLVGPLVLGMPYLTMLDREPYRCFRSGKTGEFGYDMLVPKESVESMRARLADIGAPLDLREVSLAALDQCSLENWHFCIRTLPDVAGAPALTPLELQLQSRIVYDRTFVGAEALRARRAAGPRVRATCITSNVEIVRGQTIMLDGQTVGEVMFAGFSIVRNEWVGIGLIAKSVAHPHVTFAVESGGAAVPIKTRTPPLINNRSLHVDPHRHTYRTRGADTFPPIVLP